MKNKHKCKKSLKIQNQKPISKPPQSIIIGQRQPKTLRKMCSFKCLNHQFELNRLSSAQYQDFHNRIPNNVKVNYCRLSWNTDLGNSILLPPYGRLHYDQKLPLFISQYDALQSEIIQNFRQKFAIKKCQIENFIMSKSQIDEVKFPLPQIYSKRCQICLKRQKLKNCQEYLKHIHSISHIEKLKNQRSKQWINDLIQIVRSEKEKIRNKQAKKKLIIKDIKIIQRSPQILTRSYLRKIS